MPNMKWSSPKKPWRSTVSQFVIPNETASYINWTFTLSVIYYLCSIY